MGKFDWLIYAVGAAVVWGFWGFLDKIVIDRSGWPILVIGSALTYAIFTPAIILYFGKPMWPAPGLIWVWAILGGAAASNRGGLLAAARYRLETLCFGR